MLVEQAATMAAATNTTQGTPMEEENPTPVVAEEEPPKKYEATMSTTTEQASVTPLEDENPALVVMEVPKIAKATLTVEKEAEAVKKEVVGGKDKEENEGLERKDWHYEGLEAKNGKEEGSRGGDEHMKVEGEFGILGVVEAMKNDGSEKMTKDKETVGSMVDPTLVLVVEKKLENSELEDGTDCLASIHAVEGGDKGELMKEEQQKEESIIEEIMVEGDTYSIVIEEEKPEPKGQKGEDVGFGGGDGGTLDEEKVTKVSNLGIEVVKPENKVAPFSQANDAISYDKESTDDIDVVGGQETPKELIGNDTIIEDETNMSEQGSDMAILAMNDGNIEEDALPNADSVLDDSLGKKDADDQATTTKAEDEVGVALEEKVADNMSNDVESAIVVGKEKQKLEDKENEEVGSLGGDAGKSNEGKHIEVLVLSVEAIELEDKVAPLAETNEKLCYGVEGSDDIVDVEERSVEEVTPASVYCVLEDIYKDCNVEGQATASEAEEEVGVVVEMFVAEKVSRDEKSLLDEDAKPKLEGVKGEEIHYQSRDGGELDEEKGTKSPLSSIVCVEPKASAMVVNNRSIEEVALSSEDNVFVGSLEKKKNIEGQTTASEVKEEVQAVVEQKVIDKVPDDIEFDMAMEDKVEPEGEKGEDIGSIGGSGDKLDEGKNIEVFDVSAEAIELEHKLVPLTEINESFGYVKEGNDDILDVNKESLEVPASAYSMLEGITQKEQNAARQAITSEGEGEVGLVLDMYVADNVPDDAKSLLEEEKPKLEGMKDEELVSGVQNGVELDEEKEVEVSIASIVFVEPKACLMVVNNRSKEEVDLACEGSVLMGSPEKKKIIEGQTIADEVMEDVHVVVEPKVTDKVLDDIKSNMAKEDKVEQEGENMETIGGNGDEMDDRKDVVNIEATELEDKLYPLAETNDKFGYVKQRSDNIVDVNEGTVEEEVNNTNKEEVDLACDDTVLVDNPEKKQNAESDMVEEEKAEIKHEKGGELDKEKDVEVFTISVEATELEDKSGHSAEANKDTGYVKERSDDIMVVNEGSVEEIAPTSVFSVLEDISKKEHNVDGQVTISDTEEFGVLVEMSTVEKVLGDAKSQLEKMGKPKLDGVKGEEPGAGGRAGGELDEEKEAELSIVSIMFIEPEISAMVVNDRSIKEVALASEDNVLMDSPKKQQNVEGQETKNEIKEQVHVVMEVKVTDTVLDDREFDMAEEGKGEPKREKSEEIGSVGGKCGQLDEEKDDEVSTVIVELEQKLAPSAETNEILGYAKEASDDIMFVNKESVEEVPPASAYTMLEAISKKEHNVESRAVASEAEEEVGVVVEMQDVDMVVDDANSLWAMKEEPKLEGVKDDEVESGVWHDVESDKEKHVEVFVASIVFVEQEACEMEVNSRSKEEFDLAFEDIVHIGSPENKKNTESDMAKDEKANIEHDKGGELDKEKDVEVMTVSIDATELKNKIQHLAEANKEVGYTKEESDDSMVGSEGTVEEVTLASSYGMIEDISKMEHNVVGQATPSEVEEMGVVMEMYVADKVADDAKSLLVQEKNPDLQGVKGEEASSSGEWDEEKETKVSVISMLFVEPEAGAKVVNDRSIEEVALASEDSVLVDTPETKQIVEGQTTANEVKEEVHVVMKTKVTDMVLDDREFDMTEEGKREPECEKSEVIGSVVGNCGQLEEEKYDEVSTVIVELEHKLAPSAETNENLGYAKEESDYIVFVNKESIEEVPPTSAYSVLKDISKKEHNAKSQAIASEAEEEVSVVVEMHAIGKVVDDANSLFTTEEEPKLEGVKDEDVESGVWHGVELDKEKHVEVSIANIVFVEQEACKMEVNSRSKKEVDLAFEDIVLIGSPENKQNTESDMAEDEKAKIEHDKGGELDKEKDVEVMTISIDATELENKIEHLVEANKEVGYVKEGSDDTMVGIEGTVEEDTLASSFGVLGDISKMENNVVGQATPSEVEEMGVVMEMFVADKVTDDAKSLVQEKNPDLLGVKGEEAGSSGELDEEKETEVSDVSIITPSLDVNKGSVEDVTPTSAYSVLEGISKKEYNVEGEATPSKREEAVGVVVDMHAVDMVRDDAKSVAMLKPKLEFVKDKGVEFGVRDHVELNEVEVSIASILFNEQEACAMEVNDRSTEVIDLAFEDIVLMDSPEKKQNIESAEIEGEKGGELDDEKYVEVFTVSIEATKMEDKLAPLAEANKEVGYVKKGSDDIVVVMEGSDVEEVTPASSYCVLEDISKMENNVEGQATASEAGEIGVVVETYVADELQDDEKFLLVKEENLELEGVKGEEAGSVGELDEEKESEVSMASIVFVEPKDKATSLFEANDDLGEKKERSDRVVPVQEEALKESTEAGTVVVNDGSVDEVAPGSAYHVLKNSPNKEQNVESRATASETREEVCVATEVEVTNKESNDTKHVVTKEKTILEDEKGKEVGSIGGDGRELDEEKEVELFTVIVDVVELEDNVAHLTETSGRPNTKKGSDDEVVVGDERAHNESTWNDIVSEGEVAKSEPENEAGIVVMNDGSVEEVETSAKSVLENSSWKEHNVEDQASTSEVEEEVGVIMEVEVVDDAKFVLAKEEELQLQGEKDGKVGFGDGDGGTLYVGEELEVSVVSTTVVEPEDKIASFSKSKYELDFEKGANNDIEVMEDETPKELTENDTYVEDDAANLEQLSEMSIVGVNDGSAEEITPASADSVLKNSPMKEQNTKRQATSSETKEKVDLVVQGKVMVKELNKAESIATEENKVQLEGDKGEKVGFAGGDGDELDKEKKFKVSVVNVEDIEFEGNLASIDEKNFDLSYETKASNDIMVVGDEEAPEQSTKKDANIEKETSKIEPSSKASIVIVNDETLEELAPAIVESVLDGSPIKELNVEGQAIANEVMEDVGVEDGFGDEGSEYDDESNSNTSPTLVAILESNDATKQIMKEHVEGSSNGIMLDASKDDGDEKGFDSTAYTSLLKASNGASSDENVIISSQDGSEILTMDQPTGLGSLAPSMRPTEHDMLVLSELAVTTDPTKMVEEESKLHDKVDLIRVKFMRLVHSLGAIPKEMVVTQVLYRLGLVEGIIHGSQTKRAFSLDNAWKKALTFGEEEKDDLNFSCNILVLGKTGVGKSATINSIFGEEKSKTDAFNSATTSVQEIVGDVHGVKIRIIDTPGLQPNVMDQGSNRKILAAVKKYTKKCPPDIVLYVDRLDCLSRDLNDLPLLKTITNVFGTSIWFNAIIALTHAASALEDLNGVHISYEVLMAQTSHIIQQSIRHATGDMNLVNPVAFAENHSSCQRNHEDQKVLPNGQSWRHHMLLLCYSSKLLSEANSLLKLNDPNPAKPFGFYFGSLPLPFLMSSLLELRAHPKLLAKQGGNKGDSDIELDDYFDEYDCKVKPPPSFDSDNPTYRYRFVEPTSTVIARPVLDAHRWDHDCGYDGVSVEETLAILNMFPANVAVEITKDKKEFNIHLESSIAAKHGENASSLAHFVIQTIGRQLAYILHGETKIKKNKTTGGFLVTFLGDTMAIGLKVEDHISLGKRLSLAANTGAIRAQGDTAYGANLEARLKGKAKTIGQSLSTLGFSLMKWHQELALGANLQSQISIRRGSKVALCLGLNNKLNGQIGVKTSTSEQVQIALLGLVPIAASIYRSLQSNKPSST